MDIARVVGIDNFTISNDLDTDTYDVGGQGIRAAIYQRDWYRSLEL